MGRACAVARTVRMSRVTFVAGAGVRLALAAGILIASLAPGKAEPAPVILSSLSFVCSFCLVRGKTVFHRVHPHASEGHAEIERCTLDLSARRPTRVCL
jgi:hypothetical protein